MNTKKLKMFSLNICFWLILCLGWCGLVSIEAQACRVTSVVCEPCPDGTCPAGVEVTCTAQNVNCIIAHTQWKVTNLDADELLQDNWYSGWKSTIAYTFPTPAQYRVQAIIRDSARNPIGAKWIDFPVVSNTYTITITPSAGGTVLGSIGEEDGIACDVGAEAAKCQEAYAKSQGLHLKAVPDENWIFLGWEVNGVSVTRNSLPTSTRRTQTLIQPGSENTNVKTKLIQSDLLGVMKIHQNSSIGELGNDEEEGIGAFVPVNNDDDDYSYDPNIHSSYVADKDQVGPVQGETDLLPIVLHTLNPVSSGGEYMLDIPDNIRVWQKEDRTEQVTETTRFATDTDTMLYVEGISHGVGVITLNWIDGSQIYTNLDRIKVTAFKWSGPLNVPGYSRYRYTAARPQSGSIWISPDGGSISADNSTPGLADATILWGEGPFIGKAVYKVNDNYIWEMEVNVVQIKIKPTGNIADYQGTPFQVGGAKSSYIKASSSSYAMAAEIVIETIEGPVVNGSQRGKKFLELGLMHQATFVAWHSLYNTIAKKSVSSLEDGILHWDVHHKTTIPWLKHDAASYLNISSAIVR